MRSDVIVIGAGIAGLSVAHFLARAGRQVTVLDHHEIPFGGASGAAGAFLSPMMGRGSRTMDLINRSLQFSLGFYQSIAPDALIAGGLLRYPKAGESEEDFWALEAFLGEVPHLRREGGLFFPEAGMVEPHALARALLQGCSFVGGVSASEPFYGAGCWHVASYEAPILVVANGAYDALLPDFWMGRKGVWGERLVLSGLPQRHHNLSGEVAISATLPDKTVAVGATHRRGVHHWQIDPHAANELMAAAIGLDGTLQGAHIVDIKGGMRPANNDYLPAVGPWPDAHRLAHEQPLLTKGAHLKAPMPYYPGLFVHTGHGGRGFVSAPYSASLLAGHILHQSPIDEALLPDRLLLRHFRRCADISVYDRKLQGH